MKRTCTIIIFSFIFIALSTAGVVNAAKTMSYEWSPAISGGGGRYLAPGISPYDPNLLFCGSDMEVAYRSTNMGDSWTFIPADELRLVNGWNNCPWVFHPVNEKMIFVGTQEGFYRSENSGKTWIRIMGSWDNGIREGWPVASLGPNAVAIDKKRPNVIFAAFNHYLRNNVQKLFISRDTGKTWTPAGELPEGSGKVLSFIFDQCRPGVVIMGCEHGVYKSSDDADTWIRCTDGLDKDGQSIVAFDGGSTEQKTILYVTVPTYEQNGNLKGGIYVSMDAGKSWSEAGTKGLYMKPEVGYGQLFPKFERITVCKNKPEVCYVSMLGWNHFDNPKISGHSTLYRTTDAGKTWDDVYFPHPQMEGYNFTNTAWTTCDWGWQGGICEAAVCDSDPNMLLATTWTAVVLSNNGGKTWKHVCGIKSDEGSMNDQMMLLTTMNYYFDPHKLNRRYAAVHDFCGWVSSNEGETWYRSNAGNPWPHNVYAMVFDPDIPGKVWAASSRKHDIPHWNFVTGIVGNKGDYEGGVIISHDFGDNWKRVDSIGSKQLPPMTVTDLWLDKDSPKNSRHLWASVLWGGVYKSLDDGKSWTVCNNGLPKDNLHAWRILRAYDGNMYTITTVGMYNPERGILPGGVYVSSDEGDSWRLISDQKQMQYPTGFAMDPHNHKVVYIACMRSPVGEGRKSGGVWKTLDGGQTWKCVNELASTAVVLHPKDSNIIFSCTEANGIYVSCDAGKTWSKLENLPPHRIHNVIFDPNDSNQIYVCTFGSGVWRGILK